VDKKTLETLEKTRNQLTNLREYRKVSIVLAAQKCNTSLEKVAEFFGYSLSSFHRIRREFLESAKNLCEKASWGGRRKSYFTQEQEAEIAQKLGDLSVSGGFVDIAQIKEIMEKEAAHPLHKTTIYRFLERHDFRKIAPRKYHPKRDPKAQEAFKKTSKT